MHKTLSALMRAIAVACLILATASCWAVDDLPLINCNDNRLSAGELHDGVLRLQLEIGQGRWHPQSEDGEVFTVYAFGETNKPLQNPGPVIRVSQGSEIDIVVHNSLAVAATVHGLHERPGNDDAPAGRLTVPPHESREVRFKAGAPGTYYYWASTTGSAISKRTAIDTQLNGAFVVDTLSTNATDGKQAEVPQDRVFLISLWFPGAFVLGGPQMATINGKSWPYAERFTFEVGDPVRWRWINASLVEHAMHLHGFYYRLEAIGNGETDHAYATEDRPLIATHLVETGETFAMNWTPERPGRWLFHCHMMLHMSPPEWQVAKVTGTYDHVDHKNPDPDPTEPNHAEPDHTGHKEDGMGGLIVGVTVLDTKGVIKPKPWHAERKVQLVVDERRDLVHPHYVLSVRDPGQPVPPVPAVPPVSSAPQLLGPPLVLTQGQAVEIEIVNHSSQPTAIHWHGIELESYYDGVSGWTGTAQQTTPPIEPGKSFVARMSPPRAGTFIYHTHWHDGTQIENGMYGALIVMPPGQKFDPVIDKVFVCSYGTFDPFGIMMLLNGTPQPPPMRLIVGTKYRFRFINITPNAGRMRVGLRKTGTPVQWRMLAKDGADLPEKAATMQTAELPVAVGETYDFEYQAQSPQELELELYVPARRVVEPLLFAAAEN